MTGIPALFELRHGRWLRGLLLAALACTVGLGMLLPVYSDEIGWRFQERAAIDGLDRAFSDICGANTLARPPWFMMPVRWFSAAANGVLADPAFVRLEGVACAVAWLAMVWLLTARLEQNRRQRGDLRAVIFALLSLGTLPFLLVISRPEQPLILTLTLAVILAVRPARDAAGTAVRCAAILALAIVALSYHLKGVAYVAVPAACLLTCGKGRGNLPIRILALGILAAATAVAASYWASRFACPDDPVLARALAKENLVAAMGPAASLRDVAAFAIHGADPLNYAWLAAFKNDSMSSWIPTDLFPSALPAASAKALSRAWGAALLLALAALVRFAWLRRLRAVAEPRFVLALAILASVLVWGASQINRNVYEAAHILPMLAVFYTLCLTLPVGRPGWLALALRLLAPCLGALALVSQAVLVLYAGEALAAATGSSGVPARQPFSLSVTGYSSIKADIAAAMNRAGMPRDRRQPGLMVDDLTYLALQDHRLPIHRLGVVGQWSGRVARPERYLASRKSPGIVAACGGLPDHLQRAAARSGQVCAVSGKTLAAMAAE